MLVKYEDGVQKYLIAPNNIKVGSKIVSGKAKDIKLGNCMPLSDIPVGTDIHNIELSPGGGAKLVRSAGTSAQITGNDDTTAL